MERSSAVYRGEVAVKETVLVFMGASELMKSERMVLSIIAYFSGEEVARSRGRQWIWTRKVRVGR